MNACPSRDTLSDLLDGALSPVRRIMLRRHLRRCAACATLFAEEQRLGTAARGCWADAAAPPHLRAAVLSVLALNPEKRIRITRPQRLTALATLASLAAFALLAVALVRPAVHTAPAYAAVQTAMRQIRTARWTEIFIDYKVATGKTRRFTVYKAARLNPPALRADYSDGTAKIRVPEDPPPPSPIALREEILSNLTAPSDMQTGPDAWHSREVIRDGQRLWRFDGGIDQDPRLRLGPNVERAGEVGGRLTKPGYRQTVWADPITRRVVRDEAEYYDGETHTLNISENFVYDETLSDAMFRPIPFPRSWRAHRAHR